MDEIIRCRPPRLNGVALSTTEMYGVYHHGNEFQTIFQDVNGQPWNLGIHATKVGRKLPFQLSTQFQAAIAYDEHLRKHSIQFRLNYDWVESARGVVKRGSSYKVVCVAGNIVHTEEQLHDNLEDAMKAYNNIVLSKGLQAAPHSLRLNVLQTPQSSSSASSSLIQGPVVGKFLRRNSKSGFYGVQLWKKKRWRCSFVHKKKSYSAGIWETGWFQSFVPKKFFSAELAAKAHDRKCNEMGFRDRPRNFAISSEPTVSTVPVENSRATSSNSLDHRLTEFLRSSGWLQLLSQNTMSQSQTLAAQMTNSVKLKVMMNLRLGGTKMNWSAAMTTPRLISWSVPAVTPWKTSFIHQVWCCLCLRSFSLQKVSSQLFNKVISFQQVTV